MLNLGDFDLLLAVLARRAPAAHRLRLVGAISAAAAAHERRVVPELKALVRLARADGGLVLRANLTASEPLLQLGGAIQHRRTSLHLLLSLSSRLLLSFVVRGHRVAHLGRRGLLSLAGAALLLDVETTLLHRLHILRD